MNRLVFILVIIFFEQPIYSQITVLTDENVISEGNFYKNAEGELLCDVVVVKFKEEVINIPIGQRFANINNVRMEYSSVINLLSELEILNGNCDIIKQVPFAVWGDTARINRISGEEVTVHDYSQLFSLRFENPFLLDPVIESLEALEIVEYVHQPISIGFHVDTPDDQYYDEEHQWYLFAIEAEGAWEINKGSENIKIGIVDLGADQDHPDLDDKIEGGDGVEHTDQDYHGTWVSGLAGAETNNNGIGIASLGWNLRLNTYGASILPEDLPGNLLNDIIDATLTSDIINMSFGLYRRLTEGEFWEVFSDCPTGWIGSLVPNDYPEIQDAIVDAYNQGVICFSSSGNKSPNKNWGNPENCDPCAIPYIDYPSLYSEVISVSGTELVEGVEMRVEEYNYGEFIDVSAPAKDILTTNFGGGYIYINGTSFASPLTAALAGLIKSVNSSLTVLKVKEIIIHTADKIGQYVYDENGWNRYIGYGRINAHNALNVTTGRPHKPQFFRVEHHGGYTGHPRATWFTNPVHPMGTKFNTKEYDVYRCYEDNGRSPWVYIATVTHNPSLTTHSYIDYEVTTYRHPQSSVEWFYRVIAVSKYQNYESIPSDEDCVYGDGPIGKRNLNEESNTKIEHFKIFNNYPNPFNPVTNISFTIPNKSLVKLEVYDILGNKIETLIDGEKAAGKHSVYFTANGSSYNSSGVYFYRIEVIELTEPNEI